MGIESQDCETIERARNVALALLEQNGVRFEDDLAALTSPMVDNLSCMALFKAGIELGSRPRCRLSLNYSGDGQGAFEVDIDGRNRRRMTFRADAHLAQQLTACA